MTLPRRLARHGPTRLLVGVAIASASALAQAAPPPKARLVYERRAGAERCPDEGVLRRAVAARLGYDPFRDDASVTIAAQIEGRGAALHARLTRRDGREGGPGVRDFDAADGDCEGLLTTMAIAISLAIDPFYVEAPRPTASAPLSASPPSTSASPSSAATPPLPSAASVASVAATPSRPSAAVATQRPSTAAASTSTSAPAPAAASPPSAAWHPYVGLGALVAAGAAPRPTGGLRAEAGVEWARVSLGVEGRADLAASTHRDGPNVASSLLLATLAPCGRVGALSLCALGSIGSLRGAGRQVDVAEERATLYAAIGARAALRLPVGASLSLRPHVDLAAPLRPVTLRVDGRRLWTTPSLSVALGASVALSFP